MIHHETDSRGVTTIAIDRPAARNAIHGLARWVRWTKVRHEPDAVTLRLDIVPQNGYPFEIRVDVTYALHPEYGLRVTQEATNQGRGRAPFGYLKPLNASLFLSANQDDVRDALAAGFPAARVLPESAKMASKYPDEIRIAFDGDAVLFSDEAERVFQQDGLRAFIGHEIHNKNLPLADGPLKPLLEALHRL